MKSIIDQYRPLVKSGKMTWTEFANTLLDFDIEIVEIYPDTRQDRKGVNLLFIQVEFADRASNDKVTVEF